MALTMGYDAPMMGHDMGMFVRRDKLKSGTIRYYLVSSDRVEGKVVQKRRRYFGIKEPTLEQVKQAKAEVMSG